MNSCEIVPGDIIKLTAGDKVCADIRIVSISTSYLSVDQSILTGESRNAYKTSAKIDNQGVNTLTNQEKLNILFSGTFITSGTCVGIVCKIGTKTEFGKISSSLLEVSDDKSSLKIALDEFADLLSKVISKSNFIILF